MDNATKILSVLRDKCDAIGSQRQYGESVWVTPQYINQLLNGRRDPMKMPLETLEKIFPDSTIEIHILPKKDKKDKEAPGLRERLHEIIEDLPDSELKKLMQVLQVYHPGAWK